VRALLIVACVAWLGVPAAAAPCRVATTTACNAKLDGMRVVVCFDPGPRTCWGLDLATPVPAWQRLAATAIAASDACDAQQYAAAGPRSTIPSSTVVTACALDGSACHTVATPLAIGLLAVTDGARVAVVEDERITVADMATGKVAATIAPWPQPSNLRTWTFRGDVRFVGPDRLFAELGDGDAMLARIFTAHTGATALELPGDVDRAPPVTLGAELAVAAAGSTALVFADPKRLARRSIPLFPKPAALALLAATPKSIVAVQDGGDGTVAIIDGKAATLVPGPPVCP